MKRALLVSAALVLLLAAGRAQAASIIVTIDGVHSSKGNVYVALFSSAKGFPDGDYAARHLKLPATTKPITLEFDGLAPGAYAVGAYHDENGNGKLDTNIIGYPIEGYALSNGIRAVISRPTFQEASFKVGDGVRRVTLHIGY